MTEDTINESSNPSKLSGVSVDVVLLAVVIALHVTKKDQNLKLLLVVLLVVHVIGTTHRFSSLHDATENRSRASSADSTGSAEDDSPAASTEMPPQAAPVGSAATGARARPEVSGAEYIRQFSAPPQMSTTHDVLPTSSNGANGKLVNARTNFYKDIVDV